MKKLFFVIAVNVIGMQAVEAGYPIGWRSLTSSVDTGFHSSQAQAFKAWLDAFGYQSGGCESGSRYRFCDALDANGADTVGSADVPLWCTNGVSLDGATCPPDSNDEQPDPDINKGPDNCSAMAGNPIHSGTGNKTQVEVDYRGTGPFPLEFSRTYNSLNSIINRGALGYFWQSSVHISVLYDGVTTPLDLYLQRPGGNMFRFKKIDGEWQSLNDTVLHTLVEAEDGQGQQIGWRLSLRKGGFEDYDLNGRITRITSIQGYAHHYTYNTAGQLVRVADDFGRVMQFQYDSNGRLSVFIDPDGHETHYNFKWLVPPNSFVGYTVLNSVAYPDQTPLDESDNPVRRYTYDQSYLFEYGNSDVRPLLTSIIDESGYVYAAWEFDSDGRAVVSEHHGGAERVGLTYNVDGSTTVTNALGKQTRYTYEIINGVSKVIHVEGFPTPNCAGANRHYTYYPNGLLETKTDWQGTVTRYAYDSRGLETSRIEAEGTPSERIILTEWHPTLNRRTKITEPGQQTTWTYNGDGQVLTHTVSELGPDPATQTWTYTYNANGLIATADGPRTDVNDVTNHGYDDQGNLISVTNALGHVTQMSEHNSRGLPQRIIDPNGVETRLVYHPRGWLLSTTVIHPGGNSANNAITQYQYDRRGQLISVTLPGGEVLKYEYDGAKRLTAVENALGERIEYTLDAAGNRTGEVIKNSNGDIKKTLTRAFDELSRVMDITGAAGQNTHLDYDKNDNNTATTNGRNFTTEYQFDALHRVKKAIDPYLEETQYDYDAQGRLKTVTDAKGLTTTYQYDAFDNLVQLDSPDTGLTDFTYDDAGNRTSAIDSRGIIVTYTYDSLNRLTSASYPNNPSENRVYSYDSTASSNYGIGRLTGITDISGQLNFIYNHLGQPVSKAYSISGENYAISYDYDLSGRVVVIAYPSGRIVSYQRNELGQVIAITMQESPGAPVQSVVSGVTYLPFGPINSFVFANGISQQMQYDADYRITDNTAMGVQGILNTQYDYDANNNIETIIDRNQAAQSQSFIYDHVDRLSRAEGFYGQYGYGYDEVGNRTQRIHEKNNATTTETYNYPNDSHRLSSIAYEVGSVIGNRSFAYDEAGNLVGDTVSGALPNKTTAIIFSDANRPSEIMVDENTIQYTHNSLGQRTVKASPQGVEHYHYNESGQLLAVTDGTGSVKQEYIYLENIVVTILVDRAGEEGEPVVVVLSPRAESNIDVGSRVTFVASAIDAEDGDISSQILWESSRDGNLGRGASITISNLSLGHHIITARVSDSTNAVGGAVTTVNVSEPSVDPSDQDSDTLPDAWEIQYFGDTTQGPDGDFDNDGITNAQEYLDNTHPAVDNKFSSRHISQLNPSVYLQLNEQGGDAAIDSSTNLWHGTYLGGMTFGESGVGVGSPDLAVKFDGSSGVVTLPVSARDSVSTNTFSAALWVRLDADKTDTAGAHTLISNSGNEYNEGWNVSVGTTGILQAAVAKSGTERVVLTGPELQVHQWYHLVLTFDGTDVVLYVDGDEVARDASMADKAVTYTTARTLQLGKQNKSLQQAARYFNGAMDSVALFDRALTSSEVAGLVDNDSDGIPDWWELRSGLNPINPNDAGEDRNNDGISNLMEYITRTDSVVYLRLNELTGNVAVDSSVNEWHGKYVNGITLRDSGAGVDSPDLAVNFDGSSGVITLPDSARDSVSTNSFSASMWVRLDADKTDTAGAHTLISNSGDEYNQGWNILASATGVLQAAIAKSGTERAILTGPELQIGQWYHLVLTFNGTDAALYVDGNEVARDANMAGKAVTYVTARTLQLGKQNKSLQQAVRYFNGAMDSVLLFDRALTAIEISGLATLK